MRMMKHWKAEGCDAKDFRLVGNVHALRQPTAIRLCASSIQGQPSPLRKERRRS